MSTRLRKTSTRLTTSKWLPWRHSERLWPAIHGAIRRPQSPRQPSPGTPCVLVSLAARVPETPRTSPRKPLVMAELTYLQAISDGLRTEMRRDKRVFVIGEDVGVYGGAFKVTLGFRGGVRTLAGDGRPAGRDGDRRRVHGRSDDGSATGRRDAVRRLHLLRVGSPRHRRGEAALSRRNAGSDHGQAPIGRRILRRAVPLAEPRVILRSHPGLKCVCPATPEDAKGLLISAMRTRTPSSTSSTSTSTGGSRARFRRSGTRCRSARRACTGKAATSR